MKKIKTEKRVEDYYYGCENGLFKDPLTQVEAVEQRMGINSSLIRFENMTRTTLNVAGQMYLYLMTCPGTDDSKQWVKSWYIFYHNLFDLPLDQIILTLNRIMKSDPQKNKDGIIRAQRLFKRTATLLDLKYGEIQNMMPGLKRNRSILQSQNRTVQLKSKGMHHI